MRATYARLVDRARVGLSLSCERPLLALIACFVVAMAGVLWHQGRIQDKTVRSAVLQEAAAQAAALSAFRTIYTSEVVSRVTGCGIEVTHDYAEKEGAIPLPATLSMLLGNRFGGASGDIGTRLYSPYPFPWREDTGGLRDDFARAAWEHLTREPDRPFFRFEESANGPVLRYAEADRMRSGCVDCHNSHPDTPKRDWRVGDLRGVLEVDVPLSIATRSRISELERSFPLLALLCGLGTTCVWIVTAKLRRESALLARRVEERTAELKAENEERERAEAQRREAEGFAEEILQHAVDPIIAINAEGRVLCASASVEAVFQWTPNELLGQNISVLMPEPYRSLHDHYIGSHLATGKKSLLGQTRRVEGRRKDGDVFPVELSVSRVTTGSIPLFVGIIRDLSVRAKFEEELERAHRLEAIGQLTAGIAHEINTPTQYVGDNTLFLEESFAKLAPLLEKANELAEAVRRGTGSSEAASALKAALEAADVTYLAEEIPRAIEQSLNGIDRVRKIVWSMKDFSHPGVEEMIHLDLNHAIESTITVATNEWKYVAEVQTDFDPELPPVLCLPGEFNQVVLNMIVNAAHAIADVVGEDEQGKGTITITTRQDGEFVEIRIADTGTGIPEKARTKVFDPFFTTKEVGKGTGQGLSIAYGVVVNKHGGTLEFETEDGKGTTFIIRLPLEGKAVAESERTAGSSR